MKFKNTDMTSFADKVRGPVSVSNEKWYPSITVDATDVSIGDNEKIGTNTTLHAHCIVKRLEKSSDGTKVTLEIRKGDVKAGLNPASSKKQRRLMAIAEHAPKKLFKKNKGLLKMGKAKLHDFAKTKEKGLPNMIKRIKAGK